MDKWSLRGERYYHINCIRMHRYLNILIIYIVYLTQHNFQLRQFVQSPVHCPPAYMKNASVAELVNSDLMTKIMLVKGYTLSRDLPTYM